MVQDKGKLVHAHPANELTEKLFGFESVVNKTKSADADNTTFDLSSDVVPTGKIWKITRITWWNQDGDIAVDTHLFIGADIMVKRFYTKKAATTQYELTIQDVELYLEANDVITAEFAGVAVGETCYLNIFGYEMNAP